VGNGRKILGTQRYALRKAVPADDKLEVILYYKYLSRAGWTGWTGFTKITKIRRAKNSVAGLQ